MIILIKLTVDWELTCQRKHTLINKDNIRENKSSFEHNYKVRDKVMIDNNASYKHNTPYKGPFGIKKCLINVTVTL